MFKATEIFILIFCHFYDFQGMSSEQADKRSSVLEAMRDVAVIEAMLNSSDNKGAPTVVELGLA